MHTHGRMGAAQRHPTYVVDLASQHDPRVRQGLMLAHLVHGYAGLPLRLAVRQAQLQPVHLPGGGGGWRGVCTNKMAREGAHGGEAVAWCWWW